MSHETWNQSSAQDGDETGVWVVARCEKMPIIMQLVLAGTIHTMMCEIRCEGLNLARIMTLGKNGFKVKFLITWWQISIYSWQMAKCRSADRFAIRYVYAFWNPDRTKNSGDTEKPRLTWIRGETSVVISGVYCTPIIPWLKNAL